tara:strand:- start:205 stop:630 length:426 start_codon:yes stop_codon:yes gene_type:complete
VRDRLASETAQCSWDVGSVARTVAIVVRTGSVVDERVAIVARGSAAVGCIMKVTVMVGIIVTGAAFLVVLEHGAGVGRFLAIKRRSRIGLWFCVVRRLAVWDERGVGLGVSVVLHLSKKPVQERRVRGGIARGSMPEGVGK